MPTTCETLASRPSLRPPPSSSTATVPDIVRLPWEIVLEAIRRDCRIEPERYLDEISVPLGGE
jgi:hypothetical protein